MSCFSGISSLNKCQSLAVINSVSLLLAEGLNADDLNMLGNILATVGSVLMTFGGVNDKQDEQNKENKNAKD